MNHQRIIARLRENADVFDPFFRHLTDEQARWKPAADRWSLLEVVNHLYDEEREDFRQRITIVFADPGKEWPPIDPEGWVHERRYNEKSPGESLQNFLTERAASIDWLQQLKAADWKATHNHPKMGPLSAELLLANWLAHDLFHIRQATDLHVAYLAHHAAPVSLRYAGWE